MTARRRTLAEDAEESRRHRAWYAGVASSYNLLARSVVHACNNYSKCRRRQGIYLRRI